ncbi:MAG TPA: ABC transporter permease subunit [Roseiarcus sp.]|nr:ABC transporter permease subunit [Roseiarcus sp.]
MTDIARGAKLEAQPSDIRVVKLRGFGAGERSTVPISIGAAFVILAAWWAVSEAELAPRLFLPSPAEVISAAVSFYRDGYANASMWEHVSASLLRILSAAAIAIALGVPVGLLMGMSRWAKGVFDAPIEFYWPLPPLAYLPLMIIWLGIGEASKIVLLTMAMFAPIAISAQAGVRSVSLERINAALSLGANRFQLIREIVLPSALPEILTGIRIAFAVGWSTLVAAELIAATRGIGHFVMSASQFLATDFVFVGMIAICAFAFSLAMRLVERWLVPWKGQI